jgi:LDH2 family malate/lactate/ureidoglycolate dehydrogenase
MAPDRVRLTVAEARRHSELALMGLGYDAEEAAIIADHAIGSIGRPTRDPAVARQSAILPFGGYKGFGLAFIVQAFGVLARSAIDPEKDDGYLFVVFKPDLLADLDDFKRELSELVARIKATPRAEGVAEIRIPGERAFRSRKRLRSDGIELDRQVYKALAALHR